MYMDFFVGRTITVYNQMHTEIEWYHCLGCMLYQYYSLFGTIRSCKIFVHWAALVLETKFLGWKRLPLSAITFVICRGAEVGSLSARAKMATKLLSGAYLLFLRQMRRFCAYCKFANLIQYNMQYIPCNSALLAQETLLLTQKGTFFVQRSPKSALIPTNLNSLQNSLCWA